MMCDTHDYDTYTIKASDSLSIAKETYCEDRRVVLAQSQISMVYDQWVEAEKLLYLTFRIVCPNLLRADYSYKYPHDWLVKLRLAEIREEHPDQDQTFWTLSQRYQFLVMF